MPLLYDVPVSVAHLVASQKASVFGAVIKDNVTGRILAHVQPSSALTQVLGQITGLSGAAFNPLSAVGLIQNEQIKRGIAELQNGMLLVQNLQYGTLALSGLGIGISVAGFAATLAKLKAIESRLEVLMDAVAQVTRDRRDDDLKQLFALVAADLESIDTLLHRKDPRPVAEQLQLSLTRSASLLVAHFRREADLTSRSTVSKSQIEVLWALAAAVRVCQEAVIHAMYAADELEVAEQLGVAATNAQLGLLECVVPDALARIIARSQDDPGAAAAERKAALIDATALSNGIKGGVRSIATQASLAHALRSESISGPEYLSTAQSAPSILLCLPART